MKKRFSKISIHSLGFRIFVLLAVMIVLFCALVAYNNTAAFVLMLERIHENSENTLVLYQKSLDENLSRTETYLYVFALNDADLLSLRAAEPQTTNWYITLNRIKKSFENATPNYTVDGFFCYQEATDALVLYDQTPTRHRSSGTISVKSPKQRIRPLYGISTKSTGNITLSVF